ncbi:cysteine peptidase C11 family protein [Laceyella sacchari]|uniref:clostripain-related cysteine peptidase n=1 Tax=Laceyella sacchari TaxID=37482 RepID=UPI00104ABAA0|nr:clostripain-related cysteine peptidase [Laceyella sacchari]TCW39428.1 cysteine peptidase C11 family protein [Laceyella sacchari]
MQFIGWALSLILISTALSPVPQQTYAAGKDDYTLMVYMVGSDLESGSGFASKDLQEMMKVGSTQKTNVIVETGGSNQWRQKGISNKYNQRWLVNKGKLQLLKKLENRDMGKSSTLSDFITWTVKNYPAKKYAIVFWNHGSGAVQGYGADELHNYNALRLNELRQAFETARKKTNVQFDLIGFDACLMASLEIGQLLQPYGKYLVASEELEPGHGWNYTPIANAIAKNGAITGDRLGKVILDGFKKQAQAEETVEDITLSVVDLAKLNPVVTAFRDLVKAMNADVGKVEQVKWIAKQRYITEDYGDVGGEGSSDMADLADLAANLSARYPKQSAAVAKAIKNAVKHNLNSPGNAKAKGISIYFPSKDKTHFKRNLNIYDKYDINPTYETFLGSYINHLLKKKSGIKFNNATPRAKKEVSPAGYGPTVEVKVNQEQATSIVDVRGVLSLAVSGAKDKVRLLGIQGDQVGLDDKSGTIRGRWANAWPTLGGEYVPMKELNKQGNYVIYAIPAELNDEDMELIVLFNQSGQSYEVLGGWRGIDAETGVADRNLTPIQSGDKLTLMYLEYDKKTAQTKMVAGKTFVVSQGLQVETKPLPKGKYAYGFYLTDYTQQSVLSDLTPIK